MISVLTGLTFVRYRVICSLRISVIINGLRLMEGGVLPDDGVVCPARQPVEQEVFSSEMFSSLKSGDVLAFDERI